VYTSITAVRTRDRFVVEALGSIKNQTLAAARCIVVVNGGALSDGNVASEVNKAFPDVEILQIDEQGMVPAFRHALDLCETEYISFLDSDDLWMPNKAELQIGLLEDSPETDAVFGAVQNFYDTPGFAATVVKPLASRVFSATTFRSRAFEKNGYPDSQATHFNWLYRWWAKAESTQVIARPHNDLVLRRRISASSGWVSDRETGTKALMTELRAQFRDGRTSADQLK